MASRQLKAGHHKINKLRFKLQFSFGHISNRGAKKTFQEKLTALYLVDSKVVYKWYSQPSGEGNRQRNEAWGSPASVQTMEAIQLIVIIKIDRWGTVIPLRGAVSQPLLFTVDGSRFTECFLFLRKLSTVNRQLFSRSRAAR